MKKRRTKCVAVLLAMAMLVSVLSACGSNEDQPSGNNSSVGGSTNDSGSTNDGGNTADSGGVTASEKSGSISVMIYDRGNMPTAEGTLDNNRWTQWIEENSPVANINWSIIPRDQASETMFNQFAAGTLPDVLPNYEAFPQFLQQEMVMEITDEMLDKMPNYKALLEKYPIMEKSASVEGTMYYLTKFSNVLPNHVIVIRRDWLDNLGLDLPETPEDLYNIIYAFTYNDPDGNGVDDTYGINMTTDAQRILSHMYGFPNPEKYAFDENGELYYTWDRIESWLTFVKRIVDNGCVNPDFMTMSADDDQADFLNGKLGIYCTGRFTNASHINLWKNFKTNFPDGKLDTFALPTTEYGSFNAYLNGGASTVGFINPDTEDVDAALAYINWLYDPAVSEYLFYGPDGVYQKVDEYGTYSTVDADLKADEFDWATDYSIIKNELLDGREPAFSQHANDWYNGDLTSGDPILEEFGVLYYKLCQVANEDNDGDPRKWLNDGKPMLPSDLALIQSTADTEVNNLLKASLTDSSKSAAAAVAEAKAAWINAGGERVDEYYKQWYIDEGDNALLPSDFINAKSAPELTPAAKEVYDRLTAE